MEERKFIRKSVNRDSLGQGNQWTKIEVISSLIQSAGLYYARTPLRNE